MTYSFWTWMSASNLHLLLQNFQQYVAELRPVVMQMQMNEIKNGWDIQFQSADLQAIETLLNLACMDRQMLSETFGGVVYTVAEFQSSFILAVAI